MSKLFSYLEKLVVKIPKSEKDFDTKMENAKKELNNATEIYNKKQDEANTIINREKGIKIQFIDKNNLNEIITYRDETTGIEPVIMNGKEMELDIKKPIIGKIDAIYKVTEPNHIMYELKIQEYDDIGPIDQTYRIFFVYDSNDPNKKLLQISIRFVLFYDNYDDPPDTFYRVDLNASDYDVKIFSDNEFSNNFLKTVSSRLEPKMNTDTMTTIFDFLGQQVKNKSKSMSLKSSKSKSMSSKSSKSSKSSLKSLSPVNSNEYNNQRSSKLENKKRKSIKNSKGSRK